ncbi:MAG: hypothetical protein ACTS2F_12045 [Thainema sp.]
MGLALTDKQNQQLLIAEPLILIPPQQSLTQEQFTAFQPSQNSFPYCDRSIDL